MIAFIIAFVVVTFILVVFVFFKQNRGRKFAQAELNYIHSHWVRIIDSFNNDPKHGVLDADKLLDYALSRRGFEGSLGEKLKKAGPRFSDLNGVWNAHKLRNRVAHELGDIDRSVAKGALKSFKRALNDLGAGL